MAAAINSHGKYSAVTAQSKTTAYGPPSLIFGSIAWQVYWVLMILALLLVQPHC